MPGRIEWQQPLARDLVTPGGPWCAMEDIDLPAAAARRKAFDFDLYCGYEGLDVGNRAGGTEALRNRDTCGVE